MTFSTKGASNLGSVLNLRKIAERQVAAIGVHKSHYVMSLAIGREIVVGQTLGINFLIPGRVSRSERIVKIHYSRREVV